jgi:hypothetical protein
VAASIHAKLSPRLPSKLTVAEVKQVDDNTVDLRLLDYHLPRDYQLTVTGQLASGEPFTSSTTLTGLGNGARVAFLTQQQGTAKLKSWEGVPAAAATPRDAADAVCQNEGEAAGLRGKFVAFLSEQGKYDAGCRAFGLDGLLANKCGKATAPTDTAPWLGTTGLPIVDGASNVLTGFFQNSFALRADGTRPIYAGVWHAASSGAKGPPVGPSNFDCQGWTSEQGNTDVTEFIGEYLLNYDEFGSNCQKPHGLLCLQVGAMFFGPGSLHRVAGKRVFVSKQALSGNMSFGGKTGAAAADALCQDEADAANYANPTRFHAFLSTSQSDAACRVLGATGKAKDNCGLSALPTDVWRRADDYPVASPAQLLKEQLISPISLAADGSPQFTQRPWTGVSEAQNNCNDWSTDAPAPTGGAGSTRAVIYAFDAYTSSHCNASAPVYCFEQ